MMKMKRNFLTALLTAAVMTFTVLLQAGSWDGGDWPKYKEGRVIEYLIITGNYESPRALAETIQEVTGNPILLLPANGMPPEIFLILPDGKVPAKVDQDQLSAYISGINPKRILIIGDSAVVPPEYRMSIDRKYEIVVFGNSSWNLNAIAADNLFNTNKIQKKFAQKLAAAKKAEQAANPPAAQPEQKPENQPAAQPEQKPENQPEQKTNEKAADTLDPLPENNAK